jgi:hypothetical protein
MSKQTAVECTNCGKLPASHQIAKWWENPKDSYLCCKCYVLQGNAPFDLHPLCVSTYKGGEQ